MSHTKRFLQFISTALLLTAPPARAQWQLNGVPLSTAPYAQYNHQMVADGSGGAIVAWEDDRDSGAFVTDIYVHRVDKWGIPLWAADGIAICTAPSQQVGAQIVSDAAGGAIVTWHDLRFGTSNERIYAQRVNAAGAPLWTANGAVVCAAPIQRGRPVITSDGVGGAIIAWADYRTGGADIYAQRISALGNALWSPDGVALCTAANNQLDPTITSDGAGSAIIAWEDDRLGGSDTNIFASRVDAFGNWMWVADGMGVCFDGELRRDTKDGVAEIGS